MLTGSIISCPFSGKEKLEKPREKREMFRRMYFSVKLSPN